MLVSLGWVITVFAVCEGRHWDADQMLPNVRTNLDDCRSRFHQLKASGQVAPAAGLRALIKEFAHMGAIGWTQPDGRVFWNCGGTLIWADYVLTAAHCVVDHNNIRPDTVRFGDLNLDTDEDDRHFQQLKIDEIYRHPLHRFGSKYHDIALVKLEKPVRIHETVCPACLWLDTELRFRELIATGWGSTGHLQARTPDLLKVSLKPMETSDCKKIYTSEFVRGLASGLHENHLCAVDDKMDTCEGDSGGPLQVKLLHQTFLTPFIVAVTSFGLPCGKSSPGVYTKIAPYHDWILTTMRQSEEHIEDDIFNATLCALRFQNFREEIYLSHLNKTHVIMSTYMDDHIYTIDLPSYLVKLMWNVNEAPQHCYGVLIDENTVLTVADCVHHRGIPASSVSHTTEGVINISKINVHPKYNPNLGYYNIAILRLEKLYSFIHIRPACTNYRNSSHHDIDTVYGEGRKDMYLCREFPECIDSSLESLAVYTKIKNNTSCVIPREYHPRFPDGITNELFCAGSDRFLVPGACNLKIGSSLTHMDKTGEIVTETMHGEIITILFDLYPPLEALVQLGRDCGYGEHLIATKVRSHLDWMERVLLQKSGTANTLQFLDTSRREGDSCTDENSHPGRCTPISKCQRKWKKYELTKEATFCSAISVICCPLSEIDKDACSNKHSILSKCPKMVHDLRPENNTAPMVRILDTSNRYICMGAIISDRTILTSASCVDNIRSPSVQLLQSSEARFRVQAIIPHRFYNSTSYSNDVALLRLSQSLTWNPRLHPICLWMNKTHSPLIVEMLLPFNTSEPSIKFIEVLTMYNSDCQRTHDHRVLDSHVCVKYPYRKHTCVSSQNMLRWEDNEGVPYIIGLAVDNRECTNWYYMVYSRVAALVDWIVDNISDKEIKRSFNTE
ncbi:transmembrane protease serine 9-like isoform X2 [Armigeres subalbatus]|uniref:transmembrane protease serine 9-like isoform X2 n=1 Tax=Armigeres subalbatus TaxID=124917 RepID=UPI002ED63071